VTLGGAPSRKIIGVGAGGDRPGLNEPLDSKEEALGTGGELGEDIGKNKVNE